MSGRPREQADLKKIFEGIKQIQRDYYLKPQDGSDQTDRGSIVLAEILKLLGDRKQDDENDHKNMNLLYSLFILLVHHLH